MSETPVYCAATSGLLWCLIDLAVCVAVVGHEEIFQMS